MNVELIDSMGTDLTVVNAARVSFDKESATYRVCRCGLTEHNYKEKCGTDQRQCEIFRGKKILYEEDKKLIKYLADHDHWTPFGHCTSTFRVKAPIFVARQLGKHQVGFVWNEVSRRYVDSEPEFYWPDKWRKRAKNKKQGSNDESAYLNWPDSFSVPDIYIKGKRWDICALEVYNDMLSSGVCPEQARMILPQNMYTEWYWTGSLAGWHRVCKLRLDEHTQKETQEVAQMISDQCAKLWPVSWEALNENTSS